MECYIKEAKTIAVTAYVSNFTNKLMKLHASPGLQEFLHDGICDIKLTHLQAKGSKQDKVMVVKWQIEIIQAQDNELGRHFNEKGYLDVVKIPLGMLGKAIKDVHNKEFNRAKNLIKSCNPMNFKYENVEQKKMMRRLKKKLNFTNMRKLMNKI